MSHIGIVCSSGGGAVFQARSLLIEAGFDPQFAIVTDRECGIEQCCDLHGISWLRIPEPDREKFSAQAAYWLYREQKVQWVCLFFSRMVSEELFLAGDCINIHPSLLPAYPGMGALTKAWDGGGLFHGATAHITDHTMDGGRILAQVTAPIVRCVPYSQAERVSFAQKVYLFLVLWEMSSHEGFRSRQDGSDLPLRPIYGWANPGFINSDLDLLFNSFLKDEGIKWIR